MGERFPFFYYDIVARIMPAGLLMFLTSWLLDWSPRKAMLKAMYGDSTNSPSPDLFGSALFAGILLGACYAIGVVFDSLFYALRLRFVVEARMNAEFAGALDEHQWRRFPTPVDPVGAKAPADTETRGPQTDSEELIALLRSVRQQCWTWVELGNEKIVGRTFAHAHRFAAESKMFLHIGFVAVLLASLSIAASLCPWLRGPSYEPSRALGGAVGTLLVGLPVGVLGFRARERRRWLQVVTTVDERSSEEDGSRSLSESCQQLKRALPTKPDKEVDMQPFLDDGRARLCLEWKTLVALRRRNQRGGGQCRLLHPIPLVVVILSVLMLILAAAFLKRAILEIQ